MNVQLFDSPGENGLLDWNCKVWERFMCDDDITYINTVMGSYMFNSEFLYNSGSMPAVAKTSSIESQEKEIEDLPYDPDYARTDYLHRIYKNRWLYGQAKQEFQKRIVQIRSKST